MVTTRRLPTGPARMATWACCSCSSHTARESTQSISTTTRYWVWRRRSDRTRQDGAGVQLRATHVPGIYTFQCSCTQSLQPSVHPPRLPQHQVVKFLSEVRGSAVEELAGKKKLLAKESGSKSNEKDHTNGSSVTPGPTPRSKDHANDSSATPGPTPRSKFNEKDNANGRAVTPRANGPQTPSPRMPPKPSSAREKPSDVALPIPPRPGIARTRGSITPSAQR